MTLILSASDFAIYNAGVLDNTVTGTARLHADIDSAAKGYDSGSLPSSSYCREYSLPAQSGNPTVVTISSSVDGGAYSGSWGDNAISLRAWVRKETSTSDMWIVLKDPNAAAANASGPRGYMLEYKSADINIKATKTNTGLAITGINISAPVNIWYRIRLDYIPVGTMKDVLNFYTSSAGGTNTETWELVDTVTILNTDTHYITASTPSTIEYALDDYTSTHVAWIDDFDVYVTPVG